MLSLQSKTVFITGSSIGIGRETAKKFAQEGAKVVVTYYKDKEEAIKLEKELKSLGAQDVLVTQLNVMDDKSIKQAVEKIISKFKEISVLINNAGVFIPEYLEKQTNEEIELQVRTNIEGLIKVTKAVFPYLKNVLINISSGAGLAGSGDYATYSATKFAVRGFTQSIADERRDLAVYSVNPRLTATRMTGFTGDRPEKVAEIILKAAKGEYEVESGSDINVWEYL